jgi:hypothetical protein
MANGLEQQYPHLAQSLILSAIQFTLLFTAVTIIPSQFYYRHLLLKGFPFVGINIPFL